MNLAILCSTNGTDMQAIIDHKNDLPVDVKVVLCNKECGALERARNHNLPTVLLPSKGKEREAFDREVHQVLMEKEVELILLIGYMRYFSPWFVQQWPNKIMNIHPSLLPAFAGGMDKNVHEEVLKHGCKVTGCTLHFVDEGQDTGPIIMQKAVYIAYDETIDRLKEKVQAAEQEVILEALRKYAEGKITVENQLVTVSP